MSHLWAIALKLLGLQCPSFAQRYPYILSWEWLWSFGRPHSTAKIYKEVPPLSSKMIKICNSGYAQKSPYWDLTFLGITPIKQTQQKFSLFLRSSSSILTISCVIFRIKKCCLTHFDFLILVSFLIWLKLKQWSLIWREIKPWLMTKKGTFLERREAKLLVKKKLFLPILLD